MEERSNYLIIHKEDGMIYGLINGTEIKINSDSLNELLTLYNALKYDYMGRVMAYRNDNGDIKLV